MIRHCLSSRDISSRVYSPLTCCVSVTLAPHSSIQTLSRVYNSNSDGPRLPSFRIHDPLIRFIHSRVKNTGLLKWRRFKLFYSRRFEFLIFSLSLFFSLITFIFTRYLRFFLRYSCSRRSFLFFYAIHKSNC